MFENLVSQYLLCLQSEGKTPHTLRWHRQSLRQFGAWLGDGSHPLDPSRWSASLLRSYVVFHQTRVSEKTSGRLSGAAVNSLVRSLRAFCTWLREEGFVEEDLFLRVTVPRAPRLIQQTLTPNEIRRLLDVTRGGTRNARRDEALLLFMLDTGARAQEVCTLRVDAVDWERCIARLWGKGQKERYVPFSPTTARAIQRYVVREREGSSDCLFLSEEGRPLTTSGLNQMCRRLSHRSAIHVAPHKCRHTFSIEYLRSGGSVFALQKTLGHTSLDTTLRYASMVTDDLIAAHEQHSPVRHLITSRHKQR